MRYTFKSMEEQYKRLSLLIGKEAIKKLHSKKVIVFGLGGVGGYVVEELVRSGIKHIALVDNDVINASNINRQIIATSENIGELKVDAFKNRIKAINPDIKVETYPLFYLPENNTIDLSKYDYVIDCIDTVKSKIGIISYCVNHNVKVISSLGTANKLDPSKVEITDLSKTEGDPLAKVLRRELSKIGIKHVKVVYSKESPIVKGTNKDNLPSSAFVPNTAGIYIASVVIKELINE